ncbi:hypothetical protein [Hyphomicrobium sp.]|uniref:hypothetical protein n=1 Tax=Hyphomicrobium sp. TaxID=82 RepID=UPI000FAB3BC2|nr:hypothetical protein [Hyphomicrobium sp.]RUO98296.1 MAG: hypothetical protein EKK30_12530 [Hyphomicrobium sp.]
MHQKIKAMLIAAAAASAASLAAAADTIDPAQALAQKFSNASDERPVPMKASRSFAAPGSDYEADMLARARAEENERTTRATQQVVAKPSPVARVTPEAAPPPAAILQAPSSAPPELAASPKIAALPQAPTVSNAAAELPSRADAPSIASVLLVLDHGATQMSFKPDPVICIDNRCWISNGITSAALEMPRNQAVALQTTVGTSPETCSGKSGCIYRGIRIDPQSRIDVIEVGEAGGASEGAYTLAVDKSCRKEGEALVCDNGVATQNFRIWVVPESTAALVGASSLESAVAEGLPDSGTASSSIDK